MDGQTDGEQPAVENPFAKPEPRKMMPSHLKILIGLIVGSVLGISANWLGARPAPADANIKDPFDIDMNRVHDQLDWVALNIADPIGKVFLRIVIMVVVPLVFSALVLGVYEIGDVRRLGRLGLTTLLLTGGFAFSAVLIGITLVDIIQPGKRLTEEQRTSLKEQYAGKGKDAVEKAKAAKPLKDILLDIIPENPVQEIVGAIDGSSKGNGMLAVMFFSLVFGIALTMVGERGQTLVLALQGVFDVTMVIIGFAMKIAPFAVACLLFAITARQGAEILVTLFWFILTVILGLSIHLLVVYSFFLWAVGRVSPVWFFKNVSEAMLTAFGTSSSNATLPVALRVASEKLKLPKEISQFVLTVGATGNQNGTALYEGVVVLFLAQVFGVELTFVQQVTVVLMSVLAGIGTAGVPGGSLPLIVVVLRTVGVPGEGIGLILGVDRVLDMCRTLLNVTGDLALATCVARCEGNAVGVMNDAPSADLKTEATP